MFRRRRPRAPSAGILSEQRDGWVRRAPDAPLTRRAPLLGGDELLLLGLGQMLMRRAVAVVRKRDALARRALARRRPAHQRVAVDVAACLRQAIEVLLGGGDVRRHGPPDLQ